MLVNSFFSLLIHSHTMTPFDAPGKQAFWKHCGKRRNCSWRAISPLPTVFSTRLQNFLLFSSNLKLSSANCFKLNQSKIVLSGKGLKWYILFNPLPQSRFDTLWYIAVVNIVRKGEIACNKQFLLFLQPFLSYLALIFHFRCTLKCHLQFVSIWTSLKFCHVGDGLRNKLHSTIVYHLFNNGCELRGTINKPRWQ